MVVFQLWKINQLVKQNVEENDYELFEWALQMQMKLKRDLHMVLASSRTSAYTRHKLYKHLIIVVHLAYREYIFLSILQLTSYLLIYVEKFLAKILSSLTICSYFC